MLNFHFMEKKISDIFNPFSYNCVYLDSTYAAKRLILSRRDTYVKIPFWGSLITINSFNSNANYMSFFFHRTFGFYDIMLVLNYCLFSFRFVFLKQFSKARLLVTFLTCRDLFIINIIGL